MRSRAVQALLKQSLLPQAGVQRQRSDKENHRFSFVSFVVQVLLTLVL
jgi:hypothetical protein